MLESKHPVSINQEMSTMSKTDRPSRPAQPRKTYAKPQLVSYGDIREVTQAIPFGSGNVDASGGIFKTSPMV